LNTSSDTGQHRHDQIGEQHHLGGGVVHTAKIIIVEGEAAGHGGSRNLALIALERRQWQRHQRVLQCAKL
jgi:hypothetical protein